MSSGAKSRARVNYLGLVAIGLLLGLWESLVRSGLLDYQYLPAPAAVARAAGGLLSSGALSGKVIHTLAATLVGWLTASGIGTILGLLLGLSDTASRYSMASIEVMRAIPPVSLVPVALLIFGFSLRMELAIIVFVSTWPVMINALDGVRNVSAELLDVGRMLRLSRSATIWRIVLPAAMPSVAVGMSLALSLSLVLAVVAEMIGNPSGLGNALVSAQQALQPDQMFAYVLTIGLLGVSLNAALRYALSEVLPSSMVGSQHSKPVMASQVFAPEDRTSRRSLLLYRGRSPRRGRRGQRDSLRLRGLLPLLAFLTAWQLAASEHSPYFPPPSSWIHGVATLWANGTLLPAAAATVSTFLTGLAVATATGTLVGLLVGASGNADRALGPSLEFARAMPPAAMVPIAALLIGYDRTMKVAVVVFATIWPILFNTRAGARGLDPVLIETARSLRLGNFDRACKIFLPGLLPAIFLGVRSAAPVALVITLLVELVSRVRGLGSLIASAQESYHAGQVYGLILVAGLFSLVINGLVETLQTHSFRYRSAG